MTSEPAESVSATAYVSEDAHIVVGAEADRLGSEHPQNIVRHVIHRIGDPVPIVTDNGCVSAETVVAALIAEVVEGIVAQHDGPPAQLCVAYPAWWGPYKRDLLECALRKVCAFDLFLIPAAAAAAAHHLAGDLLHARTVAVYDLGASSAEAAVVSRRDGHLGVVGYPQIAEHVAGDTFDDLLFRHLCHELGLRAFDGSTPGMRAAVRALRRRCSAAKETLSSETDAVISVSLPKLRTRVRVVRAEFEDAIRDTVHDGVDHLQESIRLAGFAAADIDAVLLVGGSCRIPLVVQSISAALRRPIVVDACPETSIATGAARMAAERAADVELSPPAAGEPSPDDGRGEPPQDLTGETVRSAVRPPHPVEPAARSTSPTDGLRRHGAERPRRWAGRGRHVPRQEKVRKRALLTATLAIALFTTASVAAPQWVESSPDPNTGSTHHTSVVRTGTETTGKVGGPAAAPASSAPSSQGSAALQVATTPGRDR